MNATGMKVHSDESCALSGERGTRFRGALLLTFLYSIVAGTVLGFIMTNVAWLTLRLGLCALTGTLLGMILSKTGQSMHCRSLRAMKCLVAIGAVVCIQTALSMYVWSAFGVTAGGTSPTFVDVLIKPHVVWQLLDRIARAGIITINGRAISAIQAWLYWILEVGTATFTTYIIVKRDYAKLSYCEPCKQWLSSKRQTIFLETPTDPSIQNDVDRGDLSALLKLKVLAEPEFPYLRLEYAVCNSCTGRGVYQVFMMRNDSNQVNEWILTPTLSIKSTDRPALAKLIVTQQELATGPISEKAVGVDK